MIYQPGDSIVVRIRELLESCVRGEMGLDEAERRLKLDYLQQIDGHTVFDHARELRKGIPEIVYGMVKDPETVADIMQSAIREKEVILVSRASKDHHLATLSRIGEDHLRYESRARMLVYDRRSEPEERGTIGIITAGTSDIPVAEEARIMAECMGCRCITSYDLGVAGLHRFLEPLQAMLEADVDAIVVAAGMEGALPTLVASVSDVPVIGLPVSTGYGLGGNGEAALMSMLQTCSPGLAAVNIDNGIGAGAMAALISLRRC